MIHRRESIADKTSDDVGGSPYERCWTPSRGPDGASAIVPFGYTGARWEALAALDVDVDADGTVESVGLYAMGARWCDAEMGRFLEQDPLGEVAGSNLYAYVDASPVMWVDPSGLMREDARRWLEGAIYELRLPGGGLSGKGVYGGIQWPTKAPDNRRMAARRTEGAGARKRRNDSCSRCSRTLRRCARR